MLSYRKVKRKGSDLNKLNSWGGGGCGGGEQRSSLPNR